MYCDFFGLRCRPFEDRADTRFFYSIPDAEEAVAAMEYEAHGGKGMALVTGDAGTGKTLLVRTLLQRLHATDHVVVLTWPSNGAMDLCRETCKAFGLTLPTAPTDARHLARLRRHLIRTAEADHRSIVIVDQAENLSVDNLRQLASLQELQRDGRQLLNLILVGQPQVRGLLEQPAFARIRQQFFGDRTLAPLDKEATAGYIMHRLRVAGSGDAAIFDARALAEVHRASHGLPRLINHVCEAALLAAYGEGVHHITREIVTDVTGGATEPRSVPVRDAHLTPGAGEISVSQIPQREAATSERKLIGALGSAREKGFSHEPVTERSHESFTRKSSARVGSFLADATDDSESLLTASAVGPRGNGDFDEPSPVSDEVLDPRDSALGTIPAGAAELCARLERAMARAERINATTVASLSQFTAVEKHLVSLTTHGERLIAGVENSSRRADGVVENVQRRVDHLIEQAQARIKSIESGAARIEQVAGRAEQQAEHAEHAAVGAEQTQARLTAFVERLADKADEVQQRMSVLMAGLESADAAGRKLDEASARTSSLAVDADRHAERLRAAIEEAASAGQKFQEEWAVTASELAQRRVQDYVDKHVQAEQERLDRALRASRESRRAAIEAGNARLKQFDDAATAAVRRVEEAASSVEHRVTEASEQAAVRIGELETSAIARLEEFEASAAAAVQRAEESNAAVRRRATEVAEQATGRWNEIEATVNAKLKRLDAASATATRRAEESSADVRRRATEAAEQASQRWTEIEAAMNAKLQQVDAAFAAVAERTEQSNHAIEHRATEAMDRAATRLKELGSALETTERHGERIHATVQAASGACAGVESRVQGLQPVIERCRADVAQIVEEANEARVELTAIVAKGEQLVASVQAATGQAEGIQRSVAATLFEIGGASERVSTLREQYDRCEQAASRLADRHGDGAQTAERLETIVEKGTLLREALDRVTHSAFEKASTLETRVAAAGAVLADVTEAARTGEAVCRRAVESVRDAQKSTASTYEATERLIAAQVAGTAAARSLEDLVASAGQLREAMQGEVAHVDAIQAAKAEAILAVQRTQEQTSRLESLRARGDAMLSRLERAVEEAGHMSESFGTLTADVDDRAARLESLHAAGDSVLARLEPAVREAQRLSESCEAFVGLAEDKVHRLDSHTAAAAQVLLRLADTQKDIHEFTERLEVVRQEVEASGRAATERIDRRAQEATAQMAEAEINGKRLEEHNARAATLIETIEQKSLPAAELVTRLAEGMTLAGERAAAIEQRCEEADKLAGRLSSVARILAGAKDLETSVSRTTEDARIVFDALAERTEAARQQSALLQELGQTIRSVTEACEQVKAEAARTGERLSAQTSAADRIFEEREPILAAFAEQTQTVEGVLGDLQTKTGAIEKQVNDVLAKTQGLLAGAQAQATQLERVCAAVRKVFSAVSATSLEARQQTVGFRKASDDATKRLHELTTETDRAANTLAQWVEEAVRVQSRLERSIQNSPSIRETHPGESLSRVSKLLTPASRLAGLAKESGLEVLGQPHEPKTASKDRVERPGKAVNRAEEITQLLAEAKQSAVETPA